MTRLFTGNFHCQGWCCAYFAKAGLPSLKLWEVRKKLFGMSLTFKLTLKIALWLFVLQFSSFSFFWENFFPGVCCDCARVMEIQGPTDFLGISFINFGVFNELCLAFSWQRPKILTGLFTTLPQLESFAPKDEDAYTHNLNLKRKNWDPPKKEKLPESQFREMRATASSIFLFCILRSAALLFFNETFHQNFPKKVFISNFWFSRKIVLF